MILEAERSSLRPIGQNDVPEIVGMLNDWEVAQWLSVPPYPYEPAHGEQFCKIMADNHSSLKPSLFGIAKRDGDKIIGSIEARFYDDASCGVGYWIGRNYWRQGYAAEALETVDRYAVQSFHITSMVAVVDPENAASLRLLQKFGFKRTGTEQLETATRRGCMELDILTRPLRSLDFPTPND